MVLKSNPQTAWITLIKNLFPSSLNIKYYKIALHFFAQKSLKKKKKLATKIYRKSTDHQNFHHIGSDHPKSLKDNIPYSQALRIKRICTTPNDFNHYCEELKQRFVSQGYQS